MRSPSRRLPRFDLLSYTTTRLDLITRSTRLHWSALMSSQKPPLQLRRITRASAAAPSQNNTPIERTE